MNNKKTNIIIILLCLIFLILGIILGLVVYDKINKKLSPTIEENSEKITEEVKTKELTTEELLQALEGEWGMCITEYNCRGVIISKNDNSEYLYTPYIMWSDGGEAGSIKNVEKTQDNIYKISVYFAGYDNVLGSSPEQTVEYTIGIAEVTSNILYIGDTKYQKITGDRETFFKSIM